jgi:hypothetical protein
MVCIGRTANADCHNQDHCFYHNVGSHCENTLIGSEQQQIAPPHRNRKKIKKRHANTPYRFTSLACYFGFIAAFIQVYRLTTTLYCEETAQQRRFFYQVTCSAITVMSRVIADIPCYTVETKYICRLLSTLAYQHRRH